MTRRSLAELFSDYRVAIGKPPLDSIEYWWSQELDRLSRLKCTATELGSHLESTSQQLRWQGLLHPDFWLMCSYEDIAPVARIWERLVSGLELQELEPLIEECARTLPGSRLYRYLAAKDCYEAGLGTQALDWIEQALALNNVCTGSQRLLEEIIKGHPEVEDRYRLRDLDEYLQDKYCWQPFATLSTGWAGQAFGCTCPSWLPYPVGNVVEASSPSEISGSEIGAELRRSIADRTFKYCSKTLCSLITSRVLPQRPSMEEILKKFDGETLQDKFTPKVVLLNHDNSCNLTCPSCRKEPIMAKKEDIANYQKAAKHVILPLLEGSQHVHISNGGEPFASRHYRDLLKGLNRRRYPEMKLVLMTNATLVTEELWQQFPDLAELIHLLSVSVDAAEEATYEVLRNPAKWSDLRRGLSTISQLRKTNQIRRLRLNFVVQQSNFRQIPAFLRFAEEHHADFVWFQQLVNYGTYTEEEFSRLDICRADHPDHAEFLTLLRTPTLSHPSINLQMFNYLVPDITLYNTDYWSDV